MIMTGEKRASLSDRFYASAKQLVLGAARRRESFLPACNIVGASSVSWLIAARPRHIFLASFGRFRAVVQGVAISCPRVNSGDSRAQIVYQSYPVFFRVCNHRLARTEKSQESALHRSA